MSRLAKAVVAALGAGALLVTGVIAIGDPVVVVQAHARCDVAKSLAADPADPADVDCVPGEMTYFALEVAPELMLLDAEGVPAIEKVLPEGVRLLPGLQRGRSRAVTQDRPFSAAGNVGADRCLGGDVRRARGDGTYWTPRRGWGQCCGEGCSCAGARCARICPSHVFAGDTCDGRICRRWPGLPGCS